MLDQDHDSVSFWCQACMAMTWRTDEELERAADLPCEQEGLPGQEL